MLEPPAQRLKKPKKTFPKLNPEQWRDILVFVLGEEYDTAELGRFLKSSKHRKCPFCNTPEKFSVIYNGRKGSGFNCFSCGAKGRLSKLLRQELKLGPRDPLHPWVQTFLKDAERNKQIDEYRRYIPSEVEEEVTV